MNLSTPVNEPYQLKILWCTVEPHLFSYWVVDCHYTGVGEGQFGDAYIAIGMPHEGKSYSMGEPYFDVLI